MDGQTTITHRPRRQAGEALLPLNSLYGDTSGAKVDFIHIEPLHQTSEAYDWSIDAHTHAGLHQVVLLLDGGVRVTLDDLTYDLPAPAVIAIPVGVVHSFEYNPRSSGFMLAIAEVQLDGSSVGAWLRSRLFKDAVTLALHDDDELTRRLELLAAEILREQDTVDIGRVATIDWLTRTLLVLLARESSRFQQPGFGLGGSDLFRDFQSKVEERYVYHWTVRQYAQALHISESTLNRICQTVAGTTAFEIIKGRLEVEARRRLIYSTFPIHRIAAELGFADASYFARFFRRRTGVSPREFRARHQPVDPNHAEDVR